MSVVLPANARVVSVQSTFPADFGTWLNTRYETAVEVFADAGLPLDTARYVARAALILWWREIGPQREKAEYNFNVGNIKCLGSPNAAGPWTGACHVLSNGLAYRAYPSLRDGIADFVRVLQGDRYRAAMTYLVENPTDGVGWYQRLVSAGYSEGSPAEAAADFAQIDTALYNHYAKG